MHHTGLEPVTSSLLDRCTAIVLMMLQRHIGFEPITSSLQVKCTTNCANGARSMFIYCYN